MTIGADDDAEKTLRTMARHPVRGLQVIDGHTLIGVAAHVDVARSTDNERAGRLLAEISVDCG